MTEYSPSAQHPAKPRTLDDCRIIQLPKVTDPRGNLTFIEGSNHIPFPIRRTYWIYDVLGGEITGGHAYHRLHEFIIAISGSFDITVDDGKGRRQVYSLNRSYYGLFVPNMIWREIGNFSTNSLCLVLASDMFNEADYIRYYDQFLQALKV
jgi:hypothetical protein